MQRRSQQWPRLVSLIEERRIASSYLRKCRKHSCPLPEDVQKELESAGADRVSVGWHIPQEKFREIALHAHPDSDWRAVDSKDSSKSIAE